MNVEMLPEVVRLVPIDAGSRGALDALEARGLLRVSENDGVLDFVELPEFLPDGQTPNRKLNKDGTLHPTHWRTGQANTDFVIVHESFLSREVPNVAGQPELYKDAKFVRGLWDRGAWCEIVPASELDDYVREV